MQRKSFAQVLGLCFVTGSLLLSCANRDRRSPSLPQDEKIQVYFNHLQAKKVDYTEPYRGIIRAGDNLEQVLIDGINGAKTSIDVAVQEFNLPLVAEALAKQAAAGIKVRVIVENSYRRPWADVSETELLEFDDREQNKYQEFVALGDVDQDGFLSEAETQKADAIAILENAKIPIIDDTADGSKGSGLMHHKFMVVDRKKVITGSANWTISDVHGDFGNPETRGNSNNVLVMEDQAIAVEFTAEFEEMWTNRHFGVQKLQELPKTFTVGKSSITVQFSPFSGSQVWEATSNGFIGETLNTARTSVNMALFVFAEQKLANILEQKSQAGAKVRVLIDPSFAFREYSDGLDLLGVNIKEKCDPFNRPWQNPIESVGTPKIAQGDKLHHKFGIVDDDIVITGSHNWSASANNQNDETLLVIRNEAIAKHFQREFDRLYTDAYLGIPPFIADKQKAIAANCTAASTTGIVNLNTASAAELATLPGIGAATAQKIIEGRPYQNLQDLDRVAGIGEKKIQAIEGKVSW